MSKKTGTARAQLQAQRVKQAEAERRKERMMRIGIAIGVVVVLVAIGGLVQWQRSQVDTDASFPAGVAAGFVKAGAAKPTAGLGSGVGVGEKDAPVLVESFEDFLCPHCAEFESSAEQTLNEYVEKGQIRLVYYPLTLSGFGRETELAANAFACATDQGKGREFHDALFANPQEWTNAKLVELGKSVGLDSAKFSTCVNKDTFSEWVKSIDQTGTDRQVAGTPTIFVNGTALPEGDTSVDGLRTAVNAALEKTR